MSAIVFPIIQKPRYGDPCNRCGVCCRQTPCLIANLLFNQHSGKCQALEDHEDGTTSCQVVVYPERYMDVEQMKARYARNGPMNRSREEMGPDPTPSEIVLDALGGGCCDMVQRCDGGADLDIPLGADLDRIKAERRALWRK